MKQLVFGNPNTDFMRFRFEAVAVAEAGIETGAELRAGWFGATLPLWLTPDNLEAFLSQLADLDRTLKGGALLKSTGANGPITISLEGLPLGHIRCRLEAELDGNILKCQFRTDQTQLRPLYEWWEKILRRYQAAVAAQ